jgi:ATP-dependent DNA helicase PIF1
VTDFTTSTATNAAKQPIELTDEFKRALYIMEHTNRSLYLTGKAGTGKSTLLQHFLATTSKHVVVLAPTGIAAINVGGETIHSFFRFPARFIRPDELKKLDNWKFKDRIDTILIDEISMVRADMIDNIDQFLRINTENYSEPFGGIQLIMIGDIFQLSPVVEPQLKQFFESAYTSPFFFDGKVFGELNFEKIELTKIFRQKDETFIRILNNVRANRLSAEDLRTLNTCFNPPRIRDTKGKNFINLTTTNDNAARINNVYLMGIKDPGQVYHAKISGDFDMKNCPTDEHLHLKPGAQIMMIKNNSEGNWVNGTIGKLVRCEENYVVVEIDGEQHEVHPEKWDKIKYDIGSDIYAKSTGTFTQLPIKLAWAITIHKSQGLTFDKAIIDFGYGTFAHGQAYVALSRCRSLYGLLLKRPMRMADIIMDKRVKEFLG